MCPCCQRKTPPKNGTSGDDYIRAAAVGDDDSIVLAGYSNGDWSGVGSGLYDFVAVKLDGDGSELWRWQVVSRVQGVGASDILSCIVG